MNCNRVSRFLMYLLSSATLFSLALLFGIIISICGVYYVGPIFNYDVIMYKNDECIRTNITLYPGSCFSIETFYRPTEYVVESFLHLKTNKTFSGLYREFTTFGLGANENNASKPENKYCWLEFDKLDTIGDKINCAIQLDFNGNNKLFFAPRYVFWPHILLATIIILLLVVVFTYCNCCLFISICSYRIIFSKRTCKIYPSI